MPIRIIKCLFLLCLSGTGIFTFAQSGLNQDSLQFRVTLRKGDTLYNRESYDSAFQRYEMAYEMAAKKGLLDYYSATNCLMYMGHCFYNQKKYPVAHKYYYEALQNARKYDHHSPLKNTALRSLNSVHVLIQSMDMAFMYPAIARFTEQKVLYSIRKVIFRQGDSAVVEIAGGLFDGLKMEQKSAGEAFALKDENTKIEHRYIGEATLISVENNRSVVSLKCKDSVVVQQGWQVRLYADIQESIQASGLIENYLANINFASTEGYMSLFNRRFYHYYYDDQMDADIMDLLKSELQIIIKKYAADTLTPGHFVSKLAADGIFKGKNVVRALQETDGTTINYFLRYAVENKNSYTGKNYKFGDSYATWASNNAPLIKEDARKFILGDEQQSGDMIRKAKLLHRQSEDNHWPDSWVDEALQQADKNYLRTVLSYGRLLNHYGRANNRKEYVAWGNFLDALRQKAFGRINQCDSFLNLSYREFEKNNSVEGMQWVKATHRSVMDTTAVSINIQTGHLMPYDIYPSPNQRYFATGSEDFSIRIWDIALGKEIHTIEAHNSEITDLAYNPGGRYLASLSLDSAIKVWNTFNYGLMNEFKPHKQQARIKFTPDGKFIISSGLDSTVNYWNPFTGELIKSFRAPGGFVRQFFFHPNQPDIIYLTCTDSSIYEYNITKGNFSRLLKAPMIVTSFRLSRNGLFGYFLLSDGSVTVVDMEKGRSVYRAEILTWMQDNSLYLSQGDFSPDSRYFVYCNKDSNTVFLDLDQLKAISYKSLPAKQILFNSDGSYYIKLEFYSPPVIVYFADFKLDDPYKSLSQTNYVSYVNPVVDVQFSANDQSLLFITSGIHKLDFTTGKTEQLIPYSQWTTGQHDFPDDDETLPYRHSKINDTLFLYSRSQKKAISKLSIPGGEGISSYSIITSEKKCLLTGEKGSLVCWDMDQQKLLYYRPQVTGNVAKLTGMVMLPGNKKVVIYGNSIKPYIIDIQSGLVTDSIKIEHPGWIVVTKDAMYIDAQGGKLYIADPMSYAIRKKMVINDNGKYLRGMVASRNEKFLYILDESFCYVMETSTNKIIRQFSIEGKNFSKVKVSHDDKTIAIPSFNGQILLYDPHSGKLISKIFTPLPNECIVTDSAGHYIASKQALQSVVFTYGGKAYNYDQFDLQLNQPHKVLSAIGRADTTTIKAYKNAYLKRLQRNGISGDPKLQAKLPSIILLNRQLIKPTTKRDYCEVQLECFDLSGKLADIKVFVNEVPLADDKREWTDLDTSSKTVTIKIPLTTGDNKVKMYCINQAGISSLKETININCNAVNQKQSTWFIGIGVNTYADPKMNLVYSAKDIRDLAASFKRIIPDIIIDTLINRQVTLQNIESLKQRLKKIQVTDRVIMAVTGHGLLSDSLDFYYATHDVDFKNPARRGLKYEDLEAMLNNTAARRKLLLIDACHSGMLDKETLLSTRNEIVDKKDDATVKVKGARGVILKETSRLNQESSFDLMQTLFADLSNDNGIVVISAAGGLEYAFESKLWQNGVFTYCVRKGIDEKDADKEKEGGNGDGMVTVQELMRYVGKKVPELTRGRQRPTSRRENIDFDWRIR